MKILPIYNSFNTQNRVSFGSTNRFYKTEKGKEIGNNSWLYREDISWQNFSKFLIHNFRNKEKVNIIQFAASDGSEGYTQIISLLENPNKKDVSKFFPIQAYDIDDFIVSKARSGNFSLSEKDMTKLLANAIQWDKYFTRKPSSYISEDVQKKILQANPNEIFGPFETFATTDILRDRIKFNIGDMFEILPKIKDNSNTVILCRNILGYFYGHPEKIEEFVRTASKVLKKDSVFVIGKLDTEMTDIENMLNKNNFLKMMKNVFLKV